MPGSFMMNVTAVANQHPPLAFAEILQNGWFMTLAIASRLLQMWKESVYFIFSQCFKIKLNKLEAAVAN